jgi:hypothetical protein
MPCPGADCRERSNACRNESRVTSDSVFVMSAPHDPHFTERQSATRGRGAEHCGQATATQAISRALLGKGLPHYS